MAVKERPILFIGAMVRAVLDGSKSVTRRVVKPQPAGEWAAPGRRACPYGVPGDLLYVRETWCPSPDGPIYRATEHEHGIHQPDDHNVWKPSIHMPKRFARLWLRVTDVRVERVQEISRGDAMAEGCPFPNMADGDDPRDWFRDLWNSINAKRGYGWESNPWVWRIAFERVDR